MDEDQRRYRSQDHGIYRLALNIEIDGSRKTENYIKNTAKTEINIQIETALDCKQTAS